MSRLRIAAIGVATLGSVAAATLPAPAAAVDAALRCEKTAGRSFVSCLKKLTALQRRCFRDDGAGCGESDPKALRALDKLQSRIAAGCGSDAVVQSAGFAALTQAALVERLQVACSAETASLVARTYGGPHGAVWDAADDEGRQCLDETFARGRTLLTRHARVLMACVDKQRRGGNCDTTRVDAKLAKLESAAAAKIAAHCAATEVPSLTALTAGDYLERAAAQARCATAIAHPDVSPLQLDCGPRAQVAVPPRGTAVQVVLDEATWGTRCGDGSSYAFRLRLAPPGFPVENVVVHMQGGGVCVFEDDCDGVSADLFEALSEGNSTGGIMSNDPAVSPFANWTKVFLPYCTQDLFIGGGATNAWPSVTVHRFGGINTRASLRYLRDVIWSVLDQEGTEGYRPDRIRMLFGGTSAGGFGALYNYHYILDDLQWSHTAAWPDSALALNNGELIGVAGLGIVMLSNTPPSGWDALRFMPPYCKTFGCAVGPNLYQASAPRLRGEAEQRFLVLSNQVDDVQVSTTFFPSTPAWINAVRQSYCATQGTNGLSYFLPAITSSRHTIANSTSLFTGQAVDGILMRDWLDLAMNDPDNLFDAVEEGSLVGAIAGVSPFPCAVD